MVRPLSLTFLTLSTALCLTLSPPVSAKSELALGMEAGCRGLRDCSSWLTTNFAGGRVLTGSNGKMLAHRSTLRSQAGNAPNTIEGGSNPVPGDTEVSDHDNGHGNDAGHFDESNPGQGGSQGSQGNGNNQNDHDDNGHGNDAGGVDSSNPGNSSDQSNSDGNGNGNAGGNTNGSSDHDDNGHGNDAGGVDSSNPGNSSGQGGGNNDNDNGASGRGKNK